jgi:alkanesulfonate monooxygenase SsuD/methylene tetrahydromethanopterin reductase-like flavin-dependent oxidoreductase (luciferase family)
MVEQTRVAAAGGLDSLFVGDHHVTGGPYYQNSPILGRLLAEWDGRLAGALYLLPLWHPVLVAEQVGTLAAIAQGPFVLQCAIGGDAGQFGGMGVDLRRRVRLFEAGLAVVRRLLAGEEVTAGDGEPWPIRAARTGPTPPQPVDVWIGAAAPPAIDRAARLGEAWLAPPAALPDEAGRLLDLYRQACAAHGRTPTCLPIRRDVHVGADRADAWRVAQPVLDAGYRGFDPAAAVVGSVDDVAAAFADLAALGYTDVLVRPLAPDQPDALACLDRLAEVRGHVLEV